VRFISIIWDDEANPNGNVQHIAEHELSIEDVEQYYGDQYAAKNPKAGATHAGRGRQRTGGPAGDLCGVPLFENGPVQGPLKETRAHAPAQGRV